MTFCSQIHRRIGQHPQVWGDKTSATSIRGDGDPELTLLFEVGLLWSVGQRPGRKGQAREEEEGSEGPRSRREYRKHRQSRARELCVSRDA